MKGKIVCKLCRAEGVKLFLKGSKCYTKCVMERKNYRPGEHSRAPRKPSDYGLQLREKQKLRRIYGLRERQFKNYFVRAQKQGGVTAINLLCLLERRLDNVLFRAGFGVSRSDARQMVSHGHVLVNKKRVNIPSFLVKVNDVIQIKEKSKDLLRIKEARQLAQERGIPSWLEVEEFSLRIKSFPQVEEMGLPVKEQSIVDFYSR